MKEISDADEIYMCLRVSNSVTFQFYSSAIQGIYSELLSVLLVIVSLHIPHYLYVTLQSTVVTTWLSHAGMLHFAY
jgi:hypothetical protein